MVCGFPERFGYSHRILSLGLIFRWIGMITKKLHTYSKEIFSVNDQKMTMGVKIGG